MNQVKLGYGVRSEYIGCLTADTCNQAPGITKSRNNENEDEAQEHKSKAIRNKIQKRVKSE